MSRKKIVAGNWKMNTNIFEGKQLITDILACQAEIKENVRVVIAPPYTHLALAASQLKDHKEYFLAAQNCNDHKAGAYTGEISTAMLKSVGVQYVILGHSERRAYYNESSTQLAAKTDAALAEGLQVIFCVGEPLNIRDENKQNDYVKDQLEEGLFHLDDVQFKNIVIAYEPVWAIGTGRTATSDQAQDMHTYIRSLIKDKYGDTIAANVSILYGGSCNAQNAAELFACPDVDGGLIGGASLKAGDFCSIIKSR